MGIAQNIIDQIWAIDPKALWAWGATKQGDLVAIRRLDKIRGVMIRVRNCPKLKKGWTHHIHIELDEAKDLYNVSLTRVRGTKVETVEEVEGVFCDQLVEVIDRMLG